MKTCIGTLEPAQIGWLDQYVRGFRTVPPYRSARRAPADDAAKAPPPPLNRKLVAAHVAFATRPASPRFRKPRKRKVRR